MNVVDNSLCMQIKQAMHDIRSPLACLNMFNKTLTDTVSKQDKDLLHNSTQRIIRIIDSLDGVINHPKETSTDNPKIKDSINIHSIIEKILLEKINEYQDVDIEFFYNVAESTKNLLISGSICDFERALSNLINNSVEACNDKSGEITIGLKADDYYLYLTITDNGKGMPTEVLEKLRSSIEVTHGKEHGKGIGFTQIRNTVMQMSGEMYIESVVGLGSKISLKFKHTFNNIS